MQKKDIANPPLNPSIPKMDGANIPNMEARVIPTHNHIVRRAGFISIGEIISCRSIGGTGQVSGFSLIAKCDLKLFTYRRVFEYG
jgi:hypothetical protein